MGRHLAAADGGGSRLGLLSCGVWPRLGRLAIAEYFVFDRARLRLHGYRLPQPGVRVYQPILPQGGLHASRVLGLDLRLEGTRLRFFHGAAAIPDANELISSLERMIDDVELRVTVAEDQARAAEERADQEARLRAEAERRLAEALEELERLKSERSRS